MVTNSGTYAVTLDISATVGSLTLGGGSGQLTIFSGASSLTLNGASQVKNNGFLELNGGVLGGSGRLAINGRLDWTAGRINGDSQLKMATNGLLLVNVFSTGSYLEFSGVITNSGAIVLTNGGIRCIEYSAYGNGPGLLVNMAGGLVDLKSGSYFEYYNDSSGIGAPAVVNYGLVRKSNGNDISSIKPPFYNLGTLDAQAGTISLTGGGNGGGAYQAEPGATLAYPGNYELDGTIAGAGTNLLNGGILTFDGIIAGQFVWASGLIGPSSVGLVATNGLMVVNPGNGSYLEFLGVMTNRGTTVLTNGGIRCIQYSGEGGGHGLLVNAVGGLIDLQSSSLIAYYNDNSGPFVPSVVNYGLVRKSSGSDTTPIYPPFYNLGTLDAETGTISLNGSYDLIGGRLNFGLNNLTNFGKMTLAGSAALTGTVSASLNNGYYPIAGDSFDVLSYGSQTGNFTNYVLPPKQAWSTNYGATIFNLTVLNSAPILPAQTNRAINELTLLAVTNTAIDLDIPADSLTYTLLAAPTNASLSAAGVITWTPNEAQGPGTNTFTTKVADNGTPSLSDTNTFTVIVYEINTAPVLPTQTNLVVNELTTLVVTNTAVDSDIPINPLTYTLLVAPTNAVISTNGVITWTPTEAQGPGTNVFITVVTDTNVYAINARSLSATNTFTVVVNEVNIAPVMGVLTNFSVNPGQTISFTATATDADLPANTLTFSLISPPAGAGISSAGAFNWRPNTTQANTTNTLQVQVTDNNPWAINSQHLTDSKPFTVIVRPLAPVTLTALGYTNSQFKLQVGGTTGPDYIISTSTNLTVWSDLLTNFSPATPFQYSDTNAGLSGHRFYRVRLSS